MALEDVLHPLLSAYVASPQWIKSSLGAAYAVLPRSLKYGSRYHDFAREVARGTSMDGLQKEVERKLGATLHAALNTVPAYRPHRHLLSSGMSPREILARLPICDKDRIKADPASFLSSAHGERERLRMFTGGSTATPMMFYAHKHVTRPKESAYFDDFDRRAGLRRGDVILNLRGRTVRGAGRPGGRLWMYEPIKRHLILSSDHLEARYMPEYVKALKEWKPAFIHAFSSALYPLAKWLDTHPEPEITARIRGVQLTSENTYPFQMELLRRVFPCPVLRGYGHTERVLLAATMPDDDRYFFWPLYGYLELVDPAGEAITEPGVLGEIVGTSFDNSVMPFIRYRTGDFGAWSASPHPELPGYPVLERIEGRLQEFVVCNDERLISVCTLGAAHFSQLAEVEAIQYEQCKPGHLVLKIVSRKDLAADTVRKVSQAVADKTQGGCEVAISRVPSIVRTGRGKQQMLIQHLDISGYLGAASINPGGA
jgi:phenylacetate-CoA ligase